MYIEVTGMDPVKFIQKVYELSRPLGMGYLHFTPGPLPETDAKRLIDKKDPKTLCSLDYVGGRSCKMTVYKETEGKWPFKKERWFVRDTWFDHTDSQLKELLEHCGVTYDQERKPHAPACACNDCQEKEKS